MKQALFLIFALVLMAACAPQAAQITEQDLTEGVVAENLPPADQTAVMVTAEGPTQLYTDRELGFGFEYPTTWTVQGQEGSSVTLVSFAVDPIGDQTAEPIPAEIPEGGTRVDVAPMNEGVTLDQHLETIRSSIQQNGGTVTLDEPTRLVDNTPAYRIRAENSTGAGTTMLITEINERVLVFTVQGDDSVLDLITRTLRDVN